MQNMNSNFDEHEKTDEKQKYGTQQIKIGEN